MLSASIRKSWMALYSEDPPPAKASPPQASEPKASQRSSHCQSGGSGQRIKSSRLWWKTPNDEVANLTSAEHRALHPQPVENCVRCRFAQMKAVWTSARGLRGCNY